MEVDDSGQEVAVVQLTEDDQGLAAGQFAAFYDGKACIGSGVILESWDDQGYPVCERALEIARMEDKSMLGKPVKIMVKPENSLKESDLKDQRKNPEPIESEITPQNMTTIPHQEENPRESNLLEWLKQKLQAF